ncbi:MAG: amino acid aminotransferase [Pseudomonadota bacterium]
MLDTLEALPLDPILGLVAACRADPNPDKVDLTVGIYMDEQGLCPVFAAVKEAQQVLISEETTKAYMPPAGDEAFNKGMRELVFGPGNAVIEAERVGNVQAPGGCGALRIAAEIVRAAQPDATVWVSDPSWPIHFPLLGSSGLKIQSYRYYDAVSHSVDFDAMTADLRQAKASDVVLLHGCCHNPCGADLSLEQWGVLSGMAEAQGFLPLVDIAYQGLGQNLDADAAGLRLLAARLPEMVVAASCSKNMGLYRERVGNVMFMCKDPGSARALVSQALVAARRIYSMPPAHGALLAGRILSSATLTTSWQAELANMCERMNGLRANLRERLEAKSGRDFGFIERENGMFSFLGLDPSQTLKLRQDHAVYMLDSSRINVAGINSRNLDYLVDAVVAVL